MASNGGLPVFLAVTAKTCSTCQQIKASFYPGLIAKLRASGQVQVEEVEYENTSGKLNSEREATLHPRLRSIIEWLPQFILVPAANWANRDGPLAPIILDGKIIQGKVIAVASRVPTEAQILNWVSRTLASPEFGAVSTSVIPVTTSPLVGAQSVLSNSSENVGRRIPTTGYRIQYRAPQSPLPWER